MLAGRTIWNVNSTAAGGGVAEMLQVLVGYVQDLDIPIGWLVITGDAGFFAITKRLHNQIHGSLSGVVARPDGIWCVDVRVRISPAEPREPFLRRLL